MYPVAGRDCMELNLSGAHGPYFTRNVVILRTPRAVPDSARCPAARRSRRTLRDAEPLVVGAKVGDYQRVLREIGGPLRRP